MKTILITGSTDGIGLATADQLASLGHRVVLHGRSAAKLTDVEQQLRSAWPDAVIEHVLADLSTIDAVYELAATVADRFPTIDVLINNAGVFTAPTVTTVDGLDVRFAVNTIAPYILTRGLLGNIVTGGRIINVSSAAQSPVDLGALDGGGPLADGGSLADMDAYAQSKLALTMWTNHLAAELGPDGPVVVSVNPGSLLDTKMVSDGPGTARAGVETGVAALAEAALGDSFASASGDYFDNDIGKFGPPHPDALDLAKCAAVVRQIEAAVERLRG